jgi:hypothetical protein
MHLDSDEQVRHALRLFFDVFKEKRSAYGVVPLPLRIVDPLLLKIIDPPNAQSPQTTGYKTGALKTIQYLNSRQC